VTKDLTYEAWQRFAGREPVETLEERLEGDMEPVCDAGELSGAAWHVPSLPLRRVWEGPVKRRNVLFCAGISLGAFFALNSHEPMPTTYIQSVCSPVGQPPGPQTVVAYNECVSASTATWELSH
jgi:hypothetical protein